jgi:hypothetical protein
MGIATKKKPKISKEHQKFIEWFKDSEAKSESSDGYPADLPEWLEDIDNSHKHIRKLLGGISNKFSISVKGSEEPSGIQEDHPTAISIIDFILGELPEYLNTYKLKKQDLLKPMIGKVKTTKHISTYARKIFGKDINHPEYLKQDISDLGNLHSLYNTKDQDLEITIDTSPEAFVNLSFYGVDSKSCFRDHYYKYYLAVSNDSFVVLFREKGNDKILARCWGFVTDENVLNICNLYGDKVPIANIKNSFKVIYKNMFGKTCFINEKPYFKLKENRVYLNANPRLSFSDVKNDDRDRKMETPDEMDLEL